MAWVGIYVGKCTGCNDKRWNYISGVQVLHCSAKIRTSLAVHHTRSNPNTLTHPSTHTHTLSNWIASVNGIIGAAHSSVLFRDDFKQALYSISLVCTPVRTSLSRSLPVAITLGTRPGPAKVAMKSRRSSTSTLPPERARAGAWVIVVNILKFGQLIACVCVCVCFYVTARARLRVCMFAQCCGNRTSKTVYNTLIHIHIHTRRRTTRTRLRFALTPVYLHILLPPLCLPANTTTTATHCDITV